MAAILFVSNLSDAPPIPGGFSDLTAHFAVYALLALLLARALAAGTWARLGLRVLANAWLIAAGYGLSDEVHQRFVPGRSASPADWVADALGAATAMLLLYVMRRFTPGPLESREV
jgi:VanZ family protein